jgi:hypothetical protein
VLDARSAVLAGIRRHISDGAGMCATVDAVAARAGHRRGSAVIRRRHVADVAARNRGRIAAKIFVLGALRERRIRCISSPGDVLDAGSSVAAFVGRDVGDGAGMSATVSAVAAGAGDGRGAASIGRRNTGHIAVRNGGWIATEIFVCRAARELRLGRIDCPSNVLHARSAVLAGIRRHVGDGARMSATIDVIAARASDCRIQGAIISGGHVVDVAVRNCGWIATEVFIFSALRERWVRGVDGPGDMLDACRLVAAMVGGNIGDRAHMAAAFAGISGRAGDDRFAAIISRRNLGQITNRNALRIATEVNVRGAGGKARSCCINSPINMLRAARGVAAVIGYCVNEVAFMDASSDRVRTSGSASDIGNAAVSSDRNGISIAGRDSCWIAAKVGVASAGDGRWLMLRAGQL